MATLRAPAHMYVSPQDSTPVRVKTETEVLSDDHGNKITAGELAASRPGNRIRKGVRQYPKE